jgi:Rod binding domain-containing protein
MTFPPATPPLKPLDLTPASRAGGTLRPLTAADMARGGGTVRPLAASDLTRAGLHAGAPGNQHDQLVEQTRKWVGQTFFGTLLKQMSDSPFKSEMFSGGRGGEAFSSMHHQMLAERMARGAGAKLVNSIVRRIEAKAAYQKQQAGAQPVPPAPAAGEGGGARPRGDNTGNTSKNGGGHVPAAARA